MPWTCECDATNEDRMRVCENCGTPRPTGRGSSAAAPAPLLSCTGCGSGRDARGWCQAGGGYDGNLRFQPGVVCPRCRQPLPFSGACYSSDCRDFPGDEYVFEKGHWILSRRGPGRRATVEEAVAGLQAVGLRMEGAEYDGKLRAIGDMVPIGSLVLHAATPGLRMSPPPPLVREPVPPPGPDIEVTEL